MPGLASGTSVDENNAVIDEESSVAPFADDFELVNFITEVAMVKRSSSLEPKRSSNKM